MKTVYEIVVEIDESADHNVTVHNSLDARVAGLISLGMWDGVTVTVRTARQGSDPTTVHVRDGRVHTERESLPPSSEE